MKNEEFWLVEIGVGMGPVALGMEYDRLLQVLRVHHIDTDNLLLDTNGKLSIPQMNSQLIFLHAEPRILCQIVVNDDRIRFGGLPVIGKRVHEILGMFKASRKETLWSIDGTTDGISNGDSHASQSVESATASRELLASGTLWITSLGLGMTLRNGLIETVHLCDPADSPSDGVGSWTKEQQRLSEVREMPMGSGATHSETKLDQTKFRKSIVRSIMFMALYVSLGLVIVWGIRLQRNWDAVPDVPAVVFAVDPPPPVFFPDKITVMFIDASGGERRETLDHTQFLTTPHVGDEVKLKLLPETPEIVLGPVGYRNVGFNTAFPYGMGLLAIGSVLQLVVLGTKAARRRKSAF
ncbi:MAG: hypothetical protein NTW52_10140 [Planctomycetota bacterium]|nr:hypothetical protein [Planctomycetota bacterium]